MMGARAAAWAGFRVLMLAAASALTQAAQAASDANLRVEFRQIAADATALAGGKSYSAGDATDPDWEPQMLLVHNGAPATLELHDSIPMQWLQSVGSPNAAANSSASASGVSGAPQATASSSSGQGSAASYALHWFDAGQRLTVTPNWLPGRSYAVVKLEAQRAALGAPDPNSGLARQTRGGVSTTVRVPLAEWVTIASSGREADAHSYRTQGDAQGRRRLLQLRVMVP